ncbi:hypothetical protein ABZP36_000601 [Zizania latifolia]
MAKSSLVLVAITSVFFLSSALHHSLDVANANSAVAVDGAGDGTKVYIVFTERQPAAAQLPESNVRAAIESFHHGLLTNVLDGDSNATQRVVYHYTRTVHGFAARLTEQEKNKLATMDAVLSVREKVVYRPQTTRSWNFLGLPQHKVAAENLPFEKDVIIGMVDTGVWPESDQIVLGNGKKFAGSAITVFPNINKRSLLIDPGTCSSDQLEGKRYKGAILLCGDGLSEQFVHDTGADGAILSSDSQTDVAFSFAIPAVLVTADQYEEIMDYYDSNSTRLPMASMLNSQTTFDAAAPKVASFSSRGPNLITPGILKPDISAPGVDILAAWSGNASVSGSLVDDRLVKYNILSGTSMACPHVTGAAAYVKSVHPDWSPAAVISSLVTTATPMTASSASPEAEFAYGAGQVNPVRAAHPGLVYDATETDYVSFLCAQGYNATQMATMTGKAAAAAAACPAERGDVSSLNYPSIAVPVINYGVGFAVDVPRMVTNVGPADSVYNAKVTTVPGVTVSVKPDKLAFSAAKKRLSFTVSIAGTLAPPVNGAMGASVSVVWSDGKHEVRSPIYVFPRSVTRAII